MEADVGSHIHTVYHNISDSFDWWIVRNKRDLNTSHTAGEEEEEKGTDKYNNLTLDFS